MVKIQENNGTSLLKIIKILSETYFRQGLLFKPKKFTKNDKIPKSLYMMRFILLYRV